MAIYGTEAAMLNCVAAFIFYQGDFFARCAVLNTPASNYVN